MSGLNTHDAVVFQPFDETEETQNIFGWPCHL